VALSTREEINPTGFAGVYSIDTRRWRDTRFVCTLYVTDNFGVVTEQLIPISLVTQYPDSTCICHSRRDDNRCGNLPQMKGPLINTHASDVATVVKTPAESGAKIIICYNAS